MAKDKPNVLFKKKFNFYWERSVRGEISQQLKSDVEMSSRKTKSAPARFFSYLNERF